MKEIISTKSYENLTEQYKALKVTNDFFYQRLYLREDFSNAYIYISPEKTFSYSINGKHILEYDPTSEEWYKQTVEADGKTLIFSPHQPFQLKEDGDVISFSKLLKNIDDLDGEPYGVILIDLSLKRIKQAIEDFAMDKPARVLFLDNEDVVLYSQNLPYSKEEIKDRIANEIQG
jgi:two-component system, sensor histidine kinase YesM